MAHILIVDDEADVITYLNTLLSDAGYRVTEARNGVEAMAAVKNERPDLVSLDMSMPEKSGVKFYREMKDDPSLATIPIVIVTGVSNPWAGKDGDASFERFISTRKQVPAPEGFFEKPVVREEYLAKVAELLA